MFETITLSIEWDKIDQSKLHVGRNGKKYLNLRIQESREKKYGNDGFASQSVSKEDYAKGIKGPILGNWRYADRRGEPQPEPRRQPEPPPPAPASEFDPAPQEDVPF